MAKAAQIDQSDVAQWCEKIATYERTFQPWKTRVKNILKRYTRTTLNQTTSNQPARFNILWSNVQTLVPAVFSRLPKPDVTRRFRDNDPVGRVAALILERALEYEIQHYADYGQSLKSCVYDRFLGGRGTSWVRYEPHIGLEDDGPQVTEDVEDQEQPNEQLNYECSPVDYVNWANFGHVVARTWEEVPAIWREVYMTRDKLIERFGEELGKQIPLDIKPQTDSINQSMVSQDDYQACIYEIWDKVAGEAIWLSKSMKKILDRKPDPLKLQDFWPCPKPLYSTLTTDSLIPTPDFVLYEDQAITLDILADRIEGLVKALQVKGVYDAAIPELKRLFSEGVNNDLLPVKNWAAFAEKNGLQGAISLVDLTPIFNALIAAYQAMENQKSQVYEITGISDIVRGATDPRETLGAQQMKGQYASLRLKSMQAEVSEFASELLQIKAQLICDYEPETITKIGGVDQLSEADKQLVPQALMLLKDEPLRNFRIEVTADSMVQMDEQAEKQDRMEFLKAVGGYIKEALPVIQASPQAAPMLVEMMKFGITAFKVGKGLEGTLDQAIDRLKEAALQPKQPTPDPEMVKIEATAKAKQAEQANGLQIRKQEIAMEQQAADAQAEREMRLEVFRAKLSGDQAMRQSMLDAQSEQVRALIDKELEGIKGQVATLIAKWNNETKIEVAEIAAQTSLDAAQISAAESAAESEGDE